MKNLGISLFLLLMLPGPVSAQQVTENGRCFFCKSGEHTAERPYTLNWKHEVPYISASVGISAISYVLYLLNPVEPYTVEELEDMDRNDVNPFDRNATYKWSPGRHTASDVILYTSVLSPLISLGSKPMREDFGWLSVMAAEVFGVSFGLANTVKNLVNRPRPYVYNPEAPLDVRTGKGSRESFYSGHVTTTAAMSFFTAMIINDYHPDMKTGWKIAMWSMAAGLPLANSYLRVHSGNHYRTDVITGYATGAMAGWLVPFLHKKSRKMKNTTVIPTTINGYAGIYFSRNF